MDKETFISVVAGLVEEYGVEDAVDLTHNLLEMGVISPAFPVEQCAQIVAQHALQP